MQLYFMNDHNTMKVSLHGLKMCIIIFKWYCHKYLLLKSHIQFKLYFI